MRKQGAKSAGYEAAGMPTWRRVTVDVAENESPEAAASLASNAADPDTTSSLPKSTAMVPWAAHEQPCPPIVHVADAVAEPSAAAPVAASATRTSLCFSTATSALTLQTFSPLQ